MAKTAKMLIRDVLNSRHIFNIPRLDLEILLCKVLRICRAGLYSDPRLPLMKKDIENLKKLVKARSKGKPIAYITNSKRFYGNNFFVDERVLIPRPETEQIIDAVYFGTAESLKILDVGTGSGNIGLTLARKYRNAEITLSDISDKALEVAKINAKRLGLGNRVRLVKSNLLSKIDSSYFDVITANLPYIGDNDFIAKETIEYEPNNALFGGGNGLDTLRKFFYQVKKINFRLLIGEFGFGQEKEMRLILNDHFDSFEIRKDLAGIPRIFVIKG